jgi:hypothetical protein
MNNLLHIQHEDTGKNSYLFLDKKLVPLQNQSDFNLLDSISIKPYFLKIIFINSPKTIIHRNPLNGFVITGVLNEKDSYGRIMSFSCFYKGEINQLEDYFEACLTQIDKSINQECLKIMQINIRRFLVLRNILFLTIISLISYQIFK